MSEVIPGIARLTARAGGLIVLLMAFVIGIDVVCRKLLGFTVLSGGAGEIAGYSLAIVTSWGASLTLLNRAHIRIDLVHSVLPRRMWVWADLLSIVAFTLASVMLAWLCTGTFLESVRRDAHSMTPLAVRLAIPQGVWAAGMVFLVLTSSYVLIKAVFMALAGDAKGADALIGSRSAEEDVAEQQNVIQETGDRHHA